MKRIFLIAFILIVAGCYSVKIDRQVTGLDHVELSQSFFFFGLLGDKEVDLTEQCPRGVSTVTERFAFSDLLCSVFTLGIYTPKTVYVNCAS